MSLKLLVHGLTQGLQQASQAGDGLHTIEDGAVLDLQNIQSKNKSIKNLINHKKTSETSVAGSGAF